MLNAVESMPVAVASPVISFKGLWQVLYCPFVPPHMAGKSL